MPHLIPADYSKVILTINGPAPKPLHTSFAVHSDTLADVADAVATWIADDVDGLSARMYSQYSVTALDVLTDTDRVHDGTVVPGTATAAGLMPAQVSPVVKLSVSARGRGLQGRMFPPGLLAEADVDNEGNIVALTLANITSTFEVLVAALLAGPGSMAVLHYGTHGGTASDVVSIACEQRTASISKRNRNTSKRRTP